MKTLALIGGTSWVSTVDYYRYINEGINQRLGGIYYSRCILHSFSYGHIKDLIDGGNQQEVLRQFTDACLNMKQAGAEGIVLCANTMHLFAPELETATGMPVIHVATATAKAITAQGMKKVALLGTKPTMLMDFYHNKLAEQGIVALIPDEADRDFIHDSIFTELGKGIFTPASKQRYIDIIEKMIAAGAEGIILGCTEIPMLLSQSDVRVPVFDTTRIHAAAAVAFSLGE